MTRIGSGKSLSPFTVSPYMLASYIRLQFFGRLRMRHSTILNLDLVVNQVYRLGDLLLEASLQNGWTLMTVAENGYHVTRQHGALVAYKLRADGLWDSIYDCQTRGLLGWKSWRFVHGTPRKIDIANLQFIAESRDTLKVRFQEQDVDRKFYEIMAPMGW
jgi:hypothetical protein